MGYPEEPAPGLSELEERRQLQRHAHSIGYVAVPETVWDAVVEATQNLMAEWLPDSSLGKRALVVPTTARLHWLTITLENTATVKDRIRRERE